MMPLLNYTTKIDVFKTIGEIEGVLVRHGARQTMKDYDEDGTPSALCFSIMTPMGNRGVRLPANVEAVHAVLDKQKVKCDREQAARVAWRILKDWVEAQMAILESQMVQMDQIFLPYFVNRNGETFYELYCDGTLMLEEG